MIKLKVIFNQEMNNEIKALYLQENTEEKTIEDRMTDIENSVSENRKEMEKIKKQIKRPKLYRKIVHLDWIYKLLLVYFVYCIFVTYGSISETVNRTTQMFFFFTIIRDMITFSVDQTYLIKNINVNNKENQNT